MFGSSTDNPSSRAALLRSASDETARCSPAGVKPLAVQSHGGGRCTASWRRHTCTSPVSWPRRSQVESVRVGHIVRPDACGIVRGSTMPAGMKGSTLPTAGHGRGNLDSGDVGQIDLIGGTTVREAPNPRGADLQDVTLDKRTRINEMRRHLSAARGLWSPRAALPDNNRRIVVDILGGIGKLGDQAGCEQLLVEFVRGQRLLAHTSSVVVWSAQIPARPRQPRRSPRRNGRYGPPPQSNVPRLQVNGWS